MNRPFSIPDIRSVKKAITILLLLVPLACSDGNGDFQFGSAFQDAFATTRPATIDTSEFKHGRLYIDGRCGTEGEIMLIMPTADGDDRIIGSPRCRGGRYELIASHIGRPPCAVNVEYGGDRRVTARVAGTDIYCR